MHLSTFLRKSYLVILLFTFLIIFIGCSSGFKTIVPMPPENYEKLGPAKGEGSGMLCVLATAYNFIPIGLNGRVERAYNEAVASIPGATGLIDVTYQETWFWLVIGSLRTVTITGEAIKEVKK